MNKIMNNKETVSKQLGLKVKLERTKRNLSQERLAEKAEISYMTVGAIERGDNSPSVSTVAAIADALEIELYKLFMFDD